MILIGRAPSAQVQVGRRMWDALHDIRHRNKRCGWLHGAPCIFPLKSSSRSATAAELHVVADEARQVAW